MNARNSVAKKKKEIFLVISIRCQRNKRTSALGAVSLCFSLNKVHFPSFSFHTSIPTALAHPARLIVFSTQRAHLADLRPDCGSSFFFFFLCPSCHFATIITHFKGGGEGEGRLPDQQTPEINRQMNRKCD